MYQNRRILSFIVRVSKLNKKVYVLEGVPADFLSLLGGGVYTTPLVAARVLLLPGVSESSKPSSFKRALPSSVALSTMLIRALFLGDTSLLDECSLY